MLAASRMELDMVLPSLPSCHLLVGLYLGFTRGGSLWY